MPTFETIYKEYENTNNVCQFYDKYNDNNVSTRFLLIRSLDKSHLIDIINEYSEEEPTGKSKELMYKAYCSSVTIQNLLDYIESKRPELISERETELEGLSDVLSDFPIVNCGVRNDKIDDIVKKFVRNKSLKSIASLTQELDSNILPRVRQYALWSYYNQTSNDIIELYFLKHPKIIPTLRKIHDIDFFIKIDDNIVPFDLKFTHISDEFFNLASQGINDSTSGIDNYEINQIDDSNELKSIRTLYNGYKKNHKNLHLDAASKLTKAEMISILEEANDSDINLKIEQLKHNHRNYVPATANDLEKLEWWNYKYQGERLFCNNNRLFVFIAYTDRFTDGRELKGKTAEIGEKITELLENLLMVDIHKINYHYDKEDSLAGNYTAWALSTIYSE